MKKILILSAVLAALLAAALLWIRPSWLRRAPSPDLPVAEVNGKPILRGEFDRLLALVDLPKGRVPGPAEKARLLAQMVDAEVLRQEALARGLSVSEQEVEAELGLLRQDLDPEEGGEGEKERTAARLESWRNDLRDRLLFLKLAASEATYVGDEEVSAYFEGHPEEFDRPPMARARQIVVAEKGEAEELRRRTAAGEDIASLARSFSIAPEAPQGGDLGVFAKGEMPAEIDSAVFILPSGGVSPVIRSPYGWHVILVEERIPPRKLALEDAREEIRSRLTRERNEQVLSSLLPVLRQKAVIVFHEENLPHESPADDER